MCPVPTRVFTFFLSMSSLYSVYILEEYASQAEDCSPHGILFRCQTNTPKGIHLTKMPLSEIGNAFIKLPVKTRVWLMGVEPIKEIVDKIPQEWYQIRASGNLNYFSMLEFGTLKRLSRYTITFSVPGNPPIVLDEITSQKAQSLRYLELDGIADWQLMDTLRHFAKFTGDLGTLHIYLNQYSRALSRPEIFFREICEALTYFPYRRVIIALGTNFANLQEIWPHVALVCGGLELALLDVTDNELQMEQTKNGALIVTGSLFRYLEWYYKYEPFLHLLRLNCGTLARLGSDLKRELYNFLR